MLQRLLNQLKDRRRREKKLTRAVHTATLMVFNKRINATQERRAA